LAFFFGLPCARAIPVYALTEQLDVAREQARKPYDATETLTSAREMVSSRQFEMGMAEERLGHAQQASFDYFTDFSTVLADGVAVGDISDAGTWNTPLTGITELPVTAGAYNQIDNVDIEAPRDRGRRAAAGHAGPAAGRCPRRPPRAAPQILSRRPRAPGLKRKRPGFDR
jgi:hypothetical protein